MIPDNVSDESRGALRDPSVMGPPIVWLASPEAKCAYDQRIVAASWRTGSPGAS